MAFFYSYPFDFQLLNEKGENEFYLEDAAGNVTLAITNSSGTDIILDQKTGDDYHFALKFRPGTLKVDDQKKQELGDWVISAPEDADDAGCMMLRINYTGANLNFTKGETRNIKFEINIDGSYGTRSTNLLLIENITKAGKARQINWLIINHRGKPNLPVELNFTDDDTILNDGSTPNTVTFRITNRNKKTGWATPDIYLNTDSRICIFFDPAENDSAAHLGPASAVAGIEINEGDAGARENLFHPNTPKSTDPLPVWIFTPQKEIILSPFINSPENNDKIEKTEPDSLDVTISQQGLIIRKATADTTVAKGQILASVRYNINAPFDGGFIFNLSSENIPLKVAPNTVLGNIKPSSETQKDMPAMDIITDRGGYLVTPPAPGSTTKYDAGAVIFVFEDQILAPMDGYYALETKQAEQLEQTEDRNTPVLLGYVTNPSGGKDTSERVTFLDFAISNIITNYTSGITAMFVRFENIPGYIDQTFVLNLDKQPLVMRRDKVGIGTNNPLQKLDVVGEGIGFRNNAAWDHMYFKHDGYTASVVAGGADNGLVFKVGNGAQGTYDDSSQQYKQCLKLNASGEICLGEGTPENTVILNVNKGNLGVGTDAPIQTLDINGGIHVGNGIIQRGGDAITETSDLGLYSRNEGNWMRFVTNDAPICFFSDDNTGTKANLTIQPDGKVGIGIDDPKAPLSFDNTSGDKISLCQGTGNNYGLGIQPALLQVYTDVAASDIAFGHGNSSAFKETMRIQGNGKVGIGTAAPMQTLDVNGGINVSNGVIQKGGTTPITTTRDLGLYSCTGEWLRLVTNNSAICFFTDGKPTAQAGTSPTMVIDPAGFVEIRKSGTAYCQGKDYGQVATWAFKGDDKKANWIFKDFYPSWSDKSAKTQGGVSLNASEAILALEFRSYSDQRLKTHIKEADAAASLGAINRLRITDYNYKDFLANGFRRKRGLIAQEVSAVLPQAVAQKAGFIPDIFSLAETAAVSENHLHVTLKEKHGLTTGDKLKLYTGDNKEMDVAVTVTGDAGFTVNDWQEAPENLFVYGRHTEDVQTLDYNEVFCTGISAIQELSRQVNQLQQKMQAQETALQQLQERLEALFVNNN